MKVVALPLAALALSYFSPVAASCKRNGNNLERCFSRSSSEANSYCSSFLAAPSPTVAGFDCVTSKAGVLYASSSVASVCNCVVLSTSAGIAPTTSANAVPSSTTSLSSLSSKSSSSLPSSISTCSAVVSVITSYVTVVTSAVASIVTITETASAQTLTITESCAATASSSTSSAPASSSSASPAAPIPHPATCDLTYYAGYPCNTPADTPPTTITEGVCTSLGPAVSIVGLRVLNFVPAEPAAVCAVGTSIYNLSLYADANCTTITSNSVTNGGCFYKTQEQSAMLRQFCI